MHMRAPKAASTEVIPKKTKKTIIVPTKLLVNVYTKYVSANVIINPMIELIIAEIFHRKAVNMPPRIRNIAVLCTTSNIALIGSNCYLLSNCGHLVFKMFEVEEAANSEQIKY